jgi:hypothetical protein
MEEAMPEPLEITLAPERLSEGTAEEKAGFGMFTIRANGVAVTEGFDHFIQALRLGPLVSGYHAAEWFAWNWWRLLYEPYRPGSSAWGMAHRLPSIGAGYVWPNVEIRSDGRRAVIIAYPSSRPDARPFRFVGSPSPWLGPCAMLEQALDAFIGAVIARLRTSDVGDTNLDRLWAEVNEERSDPDTARRRRLEALMGLDPDAATDETLAGLLEDAKSLGHEAMEEIAADAAEGHPVRAAEMRELAQRSELRAHRADAIRLGSGALKAIRREEFAWRQGKEAAERLRTQEQLGDAPIPTRRLLVMLGAAGEPEASEGTTMSFVLDRRGDDAAIVLRSRFGTGQRFDLARLLGDHLLFGPDAPALPATRSYTFRQKAQRSFAAELLSPFGSVDAMLAGDFGEEAVENVARHFDVSAWTIRTLLVNHRRLEREALADLA